MAFQVNEEAVQVMRELAQKIPNSVEGLQKANKEVLTCYNDVKETVGPHTKEIETIVSTINKSLTQLSENIDVIPKKLESLAKRCEEIIRNKPK